MRLSLLWRSSSGRFVRFYIGEDETMEKRESFVLYTRLYEQVRELTLEQKGILFDAIHLFVNGEEYNITDPLVRLAFNFYRNQLQMDMEKWEDIRQKRIDAGKQGGRPKKQTKAKKANGFSEKQTKANESKQKHNVNVNENVNVNVNENVNNNSLTCVNTREKLFAQWLESNCPYIAKHYTLPTETEFEKLVNAYGAEMVADTCQQIENRADLRKRYTNLYRTLLNWLKKEKQSNMTNNEREREKRLASYAKVANEFLNTPIRECETIPFDVEH